MAKNAVLHIGTEKTGTKTLQEFLHRNRARLGREGVLIPSSVGSRNHRLLAVAAYPPERRDDATIRLGIDTDQDLAGHQQRIINSLATELDGRAFDQVVFSSEHLQSRLRTLEDIERLRAVLSEVDLHASKVIVYLRDPVEICRSLYASSVATGSTAAGPPAPDSAYFSTVCNHRHTLENWTAVFGFEAVEPRIFERSSLIGGSVVDDFCQTIGVACTGDFSFPQDRNQALSRLGIEVLRRLNAVVPKVVDGSIDEDRVGLVKLVGKHCKGPAYAAPAEMVARYRNCFSESNEWVRRHYFPDRETLFAETKEVRPDELSATAAELDALTDLVAAVWASRH